MSLGRAAVIVTVGGDNTFDLVLISGLISYCYVPRNSQKSSAEVVRRC